MKLADRVIWIVSPESWGQHRVSKHHYALELVRRGNEVVFIEPHHPEPVSDVAEHNSLKLLNFKVTRGARKLPPGLAKKMVGRDFMRIAKTSNTQPDVIWSFDNSRLFHLDAWAPRCKRIHHLVDLNQNFETETAARSADLCLATTRHIKGLLQRYNPNTHDIGHGCALDLALPWQSQALRRPQVMYTGNLLIPLLDRDLILKAVRQHPEADFAFVGSTTVSNMTVTPHPEALAFVETLRREPNAKFTGALHGAAYEKQLAKADLFITAYRQDAREQVANPHKIPELLSTGRAIVSNVLDTYTSTDLLYMAHDHDSWLALLDRALHHLTEVNAPKLQAARQAYALNRSYRSLVSHIEELLDT